LVCFQPDMLRVNLIVFLVSANKTNIDNICVAFPER